MGFGGVRLPNVSLTGKNIDFFQFDISAFRGADSKFKLCHLVSKSEISL